MSSKNSNVLGLGITSIKKALYGGLFAVMVFASSSARAQLMGPGREYKNQTAIADTLTEKLMAQRAAIRAGTDPQAQESAIDPKTYILGPGDGVYLNVYAAHVLDQDLTVTPEGKLIVPQTGEINITGLTIPEAEAKVNTLLKHDYKNPDAHLSLRRLRTMKVSVLGEVLNPGVQTITSMMRVSEVLSKAGDLTPNSSIRIIELRRADGSLRTKADLKKYFETGDLTANPIVEAGDVIVVARPVRLVIINGAVAKSGTYEFSPGDKLSTLIALAGGTLPGARFDSIEIARFAADRPFAAQRFYVNFLNGDDEPLQEGDVISIRGYGQYHVPRMVSIGGEITYPGRYSIEVGQTRLLDIIQRAGGILPTGSIEEAVILRRAGIGSWEYDPEFVMLERLKGTADEKRFTDDQYNYYMARSRQLGRSVMVVNFKDLMNKGDQSQNLLLRDADSIWIPRERGFVSVIGSVNSPGNVNYTQGLSYKDYITRAGGYTSSADKSEVRVINSRSSGYIDPSSNSDYEIGPGDTIVIPESRSHFWENFQLVTAITAQLVTIIAGIILLQQNFKNKNP